MMLGEYELAALTKATHDRLCLTLRRWCLRDRDLSAYARSIAALPEHLQCALIVDEKRREPTKEEIDAKGKSLDGVRLLAYWLVLRNSPTVTPLQIEQLVTTENCAEIVREIRTHRAKSVSVEDAIAILRSNRTEFQKEQASCPSP